MNPSYQIPAHTRIGHVHLKVSDLKKSLDFYCGILGFELITTYGKEAARKDLAFIFERLGQNQYPFTGASDHGVSEALYLNDPDENGLELYWDKPKEVWPKKPDGSIDMLTKPLDLQSLLHELL